VQRSAQGKLKLSAVPLCVNNTTCYWSENMRTLLLWIGWCLLFVLCWPLAVLALVLFPLVWLISLPLRLVGITFEAVFAFIRTLLFLPARLLRGRDRKIA
jgi:hypothetical protein